MSEKYMCPNCGEITEQDLTGIQVLGVYDGVLIWNCRKCDAMWPRFEEPDSRYRKAVETIKKWAKLDES